MTHPMPGDLIETPRALWEHLVKTGALRADDYDMDLVETLRSRLDLPPSVDLGPALETGGVSMEAFLGVLLGVVEPFSVMMAELCSFFERHDVLRSGEGLSIRFAFEDAPELTFDLRHFRRWLRIWHETRGVVELSAWTYETVWTPGRILQNAIGGGYADPPGASAASHWVAMNTYPGRDEARQHYVPPPIPPPTGDPRVDQIVGSVMQMIRAIVDECAPHRTYAGLEAAAKGEPWPEDVSDPIPLASWGLVRLRQLDSDYFVGATAALVWRWVERLLASGMNDPAAAAAADLERFFATLPTVKGPGKVRLEQLLEFLQLPAWRARHALYQAWMVAEVERTLHDYPIEVHHRDGVLHLGTNAPPVATFRSAEEDLVLLTEHRTPLVEPVGEGRRGAIQPDYALAPERDHDNALVVIETKQYRRPNARNFVAALTDYARGQPGARVILADYGRMSATVIPQVPEDLRPRCAALGEVRPGGSGISDFEAAVREALPSPPLRGAGPLSIDRLKGVVVDVSASMSDPLRREEVLEELRRLAGAGPTIMWIAADATIRHRGSGPEALAAILTLTMAAGTDLPAACTGLDLAECAVVTDEDGEAQLLKSGLRVQTLGVVDGPRIAWHDQTGSQKRPYEQ
jgi:hypothetical protein